MIRFTFLSENKTENPGCDAEHGLSIYIETEEMTILFDTGASDLFARNGDQKHIDMKKVEAVVISHGHYDHTEGVPVFCQRNGKAPIYIHKDAFGQCYGQSDGKLDTDPCSIWWTDEQKRQIEDRLNLTDGPLWLTKNVVISGTIPQVNDHVPTELFMEKREDGTMIPDQMNHEQFLAIRNGEKGIVIFSGCSHKGVLPVLAYGKKLFPGEKLSIFIAGMHLYSATDRVRRQVVDKVIQENLDIVMPVHCTGIEAICMLKTGMGNRCVVATAGDAYEY